MAKFDKIAVMKKIGETGMVPVFYHKDVEVAKKVVKACYEVVKRNIEFVPPYESGASLYLRPVLIGTKVGIGV